MHTTKLFTYTLACSHPLNECKLHVNKALSTAHSTAFCIQRNPCICAMFSSIKSSQHTDTPTCHTDSALLMHTTASAYKADRICHAQVAATHTIHINIHYTAISTTQPQHYPPTTLLCTQITKTMHSWQNSTRCRDGIIPI